MSVRLYFILCVQLAVLLSFSLCVILAVRLFISRSGQLSVCVSVCQSVFLYYCLPVSPAYLSVSPFVYKVNKSFIWIIEISRFESLFACSSKKFIELSFNLCWLPESAFFLHITCTCVSVFVLNYLSVRLYFSRSGQLYVCVSVRPSFSLCVQLAVRLFISRSVQLSVCVSVRLSVQLSVCVYVCLYIYLSVCLANLLLYMYNCL